MKWLAVSVLGWVLVPWLALAQEKVELNTITAVKVNGNAVEITGTKKPNFSTFTMTDPPRLVIDVSEAILKGVPEETRVNNGLITGLRSANYGSETSSIARVLIGYERDVETDIQVTGNTLVVTVLDGTRPQVARAMPTPEQPNPQGTQGTLVAEARPGTQQANPTTQQGTAQANPTTQQSNPTGQQDKAALEKAQAEAAAAKKAEEDRRKQEELAQAEAAKKAEEERRKQEEAARVATAKKAEEERRAQELAAAEEKKRKIEEARADAEAKKEAEAEEKKRKLEEARAAAETKKQAEAEEKKRRAEEAEEKRQAAAEEKKRKEEEARATRVASAEPPKARPEPESPSAATVSGKHKILEIVGFQQQAQASRVYVRTNEPVSYKVSEGRNEIVLMLENTQIGKGNNTRALDTSFFDTAVARVDPTVGPDRTVRVSIKLKGQVSVQTHQEGNTISLEFPRPTR